MKRGHILVIDDNDDLRQTVCILLEQCGYSYREECEGTAGLESALKADYHLLLLDLDLPGIHGLKILESVRDARPTIPVIILTAEDGEDDRVKGLDLGADDYVVKPFSPRVLMARIEAVLRRSPERPMDIDKVHFPGGYVSFSNSLVYFDDGNTSGLSPRELEFFVYLVRHAGRVITREEILTRVYRINPRAVVGTRTVDMLATRVRKRIRDTTEPYFIQTIRGRGYCVLAG